MHLLGSLAGMFLEGFGQREALEGDRRAEGKRDGGISSLLPPYLDFASLILAAETREKMENGSGGRACENN